jgi:hypothetical protein
MTVVVGGGVPPLSCFVVVMVQQTARYCGVGSVDESCPRMIAYERRKVCLALERTV